MTEARTGESYTAARRHIVKGEARPSLTPTAEFRAHDKHCMKRPMVAFGSGPSRRGVRFAS